MEHENRSLLCQICICGAKQSTQDQSNVKRIDGVTVNRCLIDTAIIKNGLTGNCAGHCMSLNTAFGNLPRCSRRCSLGPGISLCCLCVCSLSTDPLSECVPSKTIFNFIRLLSFNAHFRLSILLFFTFCSSSRLPNPSTHFITIFFQCSQQLFLAIFV